MIDHSRRRLARRAAGPMLALATLGALLLCGCATSPTAAPSPSAASASASGVGSPLASAPAVPAPALVPGSTMAAVPPGADEPALPVGLSLVVVAVTGPGSDSAAGMSGGIAAVQSFADAHGASVSVLPGDQSSDIDALYRQALAAAPDAIVVLGPESADALDRAAASSLAQEFVVLGGQLPEPTTNVTAVVWPGADARSAEIAAAGGGEAAPSVTDLQARVPLALEIALRALLAARTGVVYTLS